MHITFIDEPTYLPPRATDQLSKLGNVVVHTDRPEAPEALQRLKDTDVAIVEWTRVDRTMFQNVQRLKYILVPLTGYSFIDVAAAREVGVTVSNVPGYSRQSVAEHAFALLLAASRNLCQSNTAAKQGHRDLFQPFLGTELYGKTLGVLGLGSIGSWVASIGQGFGMHVLGTSRQTKGLPGVQDVSLEELLQKSDALIVCVDRNPTTVGLLDRVHLEMMKSSAILVSIVSGICDEQVVAELLREGRLGGGGFDIPAKDSPLVHSEKAVLSTGIGWYTRDALERLIDTLIQSVELWADGRPQNVVN